MDYIYSIILGAVQAVTEFLPISSSGHLIIMHQFLKSALLDSLTFDVVLHAGTLLALLIYFWQDLLKIVKGFFKSLNKWDLKNNIDQRLAWLIIVGTMPAAVIGFFFGDLIEQIFRSVLSVSVMLILGGLLFIIFEKFSSQKRSLDSLSFSDVVVIGLAQALAFIPGVSRSGATILGGLARGFTREAAARFSFLMSVPIIFGALTRKISQVETADLSLNFIFVSILGTAVAALIGYGVIKFFLRFLAKHSLMVFAVYRFILAAALLLFFL